MGTVFIKDKFWKDDDYNLRVEFIMVINSLRLNPFIVVRRYANSPQRAQVDNWNVSRLSCPSTLEHCYHLCEDFIPKEKRQNRIGLYDTDVVIDTTAWSWIMEVYNEMLWEWDIPMRDAIKIVPIEELYLKCYPLHEASVSSRVRHWMEEYQNGIRNKEDAKFVFFHLMDGPNGWCSNWYPAEFREGNLTFHNVEQYLMYHKALTFGDTETANEIMADSDPVKVKELGRKVRGYIDSKWASIRYGICYEGNRLKFTQNDGLRNELLATTGEFAECAPNDLVWGIGLDIRDKKCFDINEWRGQNLLGQILTSLRDELKG